MLQLVGKYWRDKTSTEPLYFQAYDSNKILTFEYKIVFLLNQKDKTVPILSDEPPLDLVATHLLQKFINAVIIQEKRSLDKQYHSYKQDLQHAQTEINKPV